MNHSKSALDLIGSTPLLALDRVREHLRLRPRIFAKLEYYNPGGSIKDRIALKMVELAEREGRLKPRQRIVELTSGNTGIGLAVVSAIKGYRFTAVMSEGNSPERRRIMRALGAEVVLVPQAEGGIPGRVTKEDLELVEQRTESLVKRLGAFRPDQFANRGNVLSHEEGTGEEIWTGLKGEVDYFAAMVGTAGTFVGVARALKRHDPDVRCYAAEPAGAPILAGRPIRTTKHKIQGTGYAMVPPLWDASICDGYLRVTDAEAIGASRLLAMKEAVLSGFSAGANVAACLKLAKKARREENIVTILPDTGLKYLSTDLFA